MAKNKIPLWEAVIIDLQDGASLLTDNSFPGAYVCPLLTPEYYIRNQTFNRLKDDGFIYQSLGHPFDFILTQKGHSFKK